MYPRRSWLFNGIAIAIAAILWLESSSGMWRFFDGQQEPTTTRSIFFKDYHLMDPGGDSRTVTRCRKYPTAEAILLPELPDRSLIDDLQSTLGNSTFERIFSSCSATCQVQTFD
jgi:hypothetical protein